MSTPLRSSLVFCFIVLIQTFSQIAEATETPLGNTPNKVTLSSKNSHRSATVSLVTFSSMNTGNLTLGANAALGQGQNSMSTISWKLMVDILQELPVKPHLNHLYPLIPTALSALLLMDNMASHLNNHLYLEQFSIDENRIKLFIGDANTMTSFSIELISQNGEMPLIIVSSDDQQDTFEIQPVIYPQVSKWSFMNPALIRWLVMAAEMSITCKTQHAIGKRL